MTSKSPLRNETKFIALEATSSGTSIDKVSYGSDFTPSISLSITCGLPTCNSYPSLRIVSIKTDK